MTAIDEVRAGAPDEAALALVMRAGAQVAGGFPPPEGFGSWTRDAIAEMVGSLFEAKPHLLTAALAKGVASDDALEAFVLTAFRRHLIDEAKKTEIGKMRRRFEKVLGKDGRFVFSKVPVHSWTLVEFPGHVWSGDLDVLRAAAAQVRGVYVTALNSSGPTPKSVADPIRAIVAAVLADAAGAVPAQDLARVVLERLFPGEQPLEYLDEPGRSEDDFAADEPGPGFVVEIESAAESVFASLSVAERALVPHLGKSAAERAGLLEGASSATIEVLAASVTEKIRRAVGEDSDVEAEQVVQTLLNMCRERP